MSNLHSTQGPDGLSTGQDGRHPPLGRRSNRTHRDNRLDKAKYFGVLLLFLSDRQRWPLSDDQIFWIVYQSRKLNELQLLKAGRFHQSVLMKETTFSRLRRDIEKIYLSVPSLSPKRIPEKRRIGIGYRDKGALRPLHLKRIIGTESWWGEDIEYLLPIEVEKDRFYTAEEVRSLTGENHLELALKSVRENSLLELKINSKGRNQKTGES